MTNITFDTRRGPALLVLTVLAALFGLLVLPPLATNTAPSAAKPPATKQTAPLQCGDLKVPAHYYTYESHKESSHAFGPAVSASNATDELRNRLCGFIAPDGSIVGGDWALLRALQGMVDGTDPNRPLTPREWQEEVRDFSNRITWNLYRVEHQNARHGSQFTLYMTGTPGHQPTVHSYWKDHQKASDYLLITVHSKDGKSGKRLELRLNCGFQPVYYRSYEAPKALRQLNTA